MAVAVGHSVHFQMATVICKKKKVSIEHYTVVGKLPQSLDIAPKFLSGAHRMKTYIIFTFLDMA
jgi:hypothetical protein